MCTGVFMVLYFFVSFVSFCISPISITCSIFSIPPWRPLPHPLLKYRSLTLASPNKHRLDKVRAFIARTSIANFPLLPIDPSILLYFHKANGRVPATFQPRDYEEGYFVKAKQQRTEHVQTKRKMKRAEKRKIYEEKKRKELEASLKLEALTKGAEEEKDEGPVEGYQPTGFKFGQMS